MLPVMVMEPAGKPPELGMLGNSFVGLTALGFSLAAGPAAAPVVLVMAPPYLQRLFMLVAAEWQRKAPVVAAAALAAAQQKEPAWTETDVCERLTSDSELLALTRRVLTAADRTGRTEKLQWLGHVLGLALADGDRMDEAGVLVAALDDMDALHGAALQQLLHLPPRAPAQEPKNAWMVYELVDALGLNEGMVRSLVGTFVRHGLARDARGPYTPETYEVTVLGRALATAILSADRTRRD